MNLASVDPDAPKHFKELQHFYVAFFDMTENINSFEDLDFRFNQFEPVRSYHPEGAIAAATKNNAPSANIFPGDYFIVAAPGLELMWRIAVVRTGMGDVVNDSKFATHPDPFGEITRSFRGDYFQSYVQGDEEPEEDPDVDLSDYFASRRELVDA